MGQKGEADEIVGGLHSLEKRSEIEVEESVAVDDRAPGPRSPRGPDLEPRAIPPAVSMSSVSREMAIAVVDSISSSLRLHRLRRGARY